jgi:serine/threonine protein kinase
MHRTLVDKSAKSMKYGRHGDINPWNILWYNENYGDETVLQGTLKLTDFGQAELNTSLSKSKEKDVARTPSYRPPECDLPASFIRQTYDIWCLGCVFLEFATWMLGGRQLLSKFILQRFTPEPFSQTGGRSDIFFQLVRDKSTQQLRPEIKPEVTDVSQSCMALPSTAC